MKLAIICPQDFTVVLCCKWIIKILNEKGYEIYVISPKSKDDYFYNKISKLNVKFIQIKMNRHLNIIDDIKYIFQLYSILKKEKIKLTISMCTKPNIYSPIAARIANVKKIFISIWGRGTIFLETKSLKIILIRFVLLKLYRLSFKIADSIWFTNENDLKYFRDKKMLKTDKLILTPNYIDSDEFKQFNLDSDLKKNLFKEFKFNKKDFIIIMVARMIYSKGIKEFVESSIKVNKLYPEVKFLLVGAEETNNPDSVPSHYFKKLKKYRHIKWLGFRNDIKDLYSISKIAVLPSYYPEGGYPRTLTEPMSMGKGVIAANTKDCRGPVTDEFNGLLVEPKNSDDLSNKIIKLISDPDKLKIIGNNARKTIVEKYDERKIIKKLLERF